MNAAAPSAPRWLGALPVLALLLLWELACRIGGIPPTLLPAPSAVAVRAATLLADPDFLAQLGITLRRLAAGLALAVVAGAALGIAASLWRITAQALQTLIGLLAPLPKIALYPALLLTLGFADASKIALVFIDAIFPVLIATFQAVRQMDSRLLWSAAAMGTSRPRSLTRVVLPACLPAIVTGARVSSVIACIVVLLSEMLASSDGLGHVLVAASRSFRTADMFVPVAIIAVTGFALDKALGVAARKAAHR
ncbi:MAG: ABC transporter permease [Lautropia sp.]